MKNKNKNMIQSKQPTEDKLKVLTEKKFDTMVKNLHGKGVVIEKDGKQVVVEHPEKKYCVQLNSPDGTPKLPGECVLEEIHETDISEQAVFKSKGGKTYRMEIRNIFLFPC
jgi:hypothetical protein